MPRCLFQISPKRMCAYFEGGHLLCVALNKLDNGLVVSGKFTAFTKSVQSNRTKIKRREYKHMDTEITRSDLTEKKHYFPFLTPLYSKPKKLKTHQNSEEKSLKQIEHLWFELLAK